MKNDRCKKIIIGVSSCLLGNKVRYDGLDELQPYIKENLNHQFTLVAVCPELELGMGVPREKIKLLGNKAQPKLIAPESMTDWTERMTEFSNTRLKQNDLAGLSGFIFKSKSPSCGIKSVKLYQDDKSFKRIGTGLFANALITKFPLLPVIEESELLDEPSREQFIESVIKFMKQDF